jgi:CubicO group peptidase (beta-lactamase class C family)
LQHGNWNGTQIVPSEWVAESTRFYSNPGDGDGYGYLWWVNGFGLPVNSFSARGAPGKCLVVIPERNTVIVYLNHAEFPDNVSAISEADLDRLPTASHAQIGRLLNLLLDAQKPAIATAADLAN